MGRKLVRRCLVFLVALYSKRTMRPMLSLVDMRLASWSLNLESSRWERASLVNSTVYWAMGPGERVVEKETEQR